MLATSSPATTCSRLGVATLCAVLVLGVLILASCNDSAASAPVPRTRTAALQPALKPRVVRTEATPLPTPIPTSTPSLAVTPAAPRLAAPIRFATPTPAQPKLSAATSPRSPSNAEEGSPVTPKATAAANASRIAWPTATSLSNPLGFVQVATGENHACGLQRDGQVYCWGENDVGQLNAPNDIKFSQITSGWRFSCGLRTTGAIACWGRNNHKQADAPDGQFTFVDAGWDHACGLRDSGAICWGREADGRTLAPPEIRFTKVSAGAEHSCGLTVTDDLVCWGRNDNGRAEALSGQFRTLTAGIGHTCVVDAAGNPVCQGQNVDGQSSPPDTSLQEISAGADITCGLGKDGDVACWGGKRWSDSIGTQRHSLPGHFKSISVGWNGVCAVTDEGYVQCWGYTTSGALLLPYLPKQLEHPFLRHALSLPYHELHLSEAFPSDTLENSTDIFPWTNGGMVVVDRKGRISLYTSDANPQVILDLTDKVNPDGSERGMLSSALDPVFDSNPFLYVYYTMRFDEETDLARARLARYSINESRARPDSELIILDIERSKEQHLHYGGSIRFGPDGMLYLGIGDSTCLACPQDLAALHGKIIRIDVRGASAEKPYRVPDDNPFVDRPNARPEVWAYGLRNPWRMSFDQKIGTLWVGDVGRATQEEVSIVDAGANLGWPVFEGADCFTIPDNATDEIRHLIDSYECGTLEGATAPIVTYGRRWGCPGDSTCSQKLGYHPTITYGYPERCAVVGGVVYRGAAIPWLDGTYLFGDFCSGQVWALDGNADEGLRMIQIADLPYPVSSFGTDELGEVYVLTFGGPILRLVGADS